MNADVYQLRQSVEQPLGPAIVSVSGVFFGYPGTTRTVLSDIELEIPQGAITAILGPNGTGKTTLLHLILGILTPEQGEVSIAGRPQSDYMRRELSQLIGLVPQDEYITFDFTVLEYVLLGRAPYIGPLDMPGVNDRQVAADALQRVGIHHLSDRPVANLSGGERQLVVIARALAQQPRILLLDEPTAHLDLGNQSRILTILRTLNEQGVTIILSTHDPNIASGLARFVVLMAGGIALEAGPTEVLLTSEKLSAIYGVPVEALRIDNRLLITLR